jgi:hypothetical protein
MRNLNLNGLKFWPVERRPNQKNKMKNNMKEFIIKNFKTIVFLIFGVFIFYWLMFVLTPSIKMSTESQAKIDSLNRNIMRYEEENKKIDSVISMYYVEISKIDNAIDSIKRQKTIIKEFYHEKIISIDTFSRAQIDDFFTKRYGQHP